MFSGWHLGVGVFSPLFRHLLGLLRLVDFLVIVVISLVFGVARGYLVFSVLLRISWAFEAVEGFR